MSVESEFCAICNPCRCTEAWRTPGCFCHPECWKLKGIYCRCASSPGLRVNLAIKHERVESSAGYADGTIQAEKNAKSIGKQGKLLISGWCCLIALIFPFLWGCICHTKEQERCHKQHMHSSAAGENQQSEADMQAVRTYHKPDSHMSGKARGFR